MIQIDLGHKITVNKPLLPKHDLSLEIFGSLPHGLDPVFVLAVLVRDGVVNATEAGHVVGLIFDGEEANLGILLLLDFGVSRLNEEAFEGVAEQGHLDLGSRLDLVRRLDRELHGGRVSLEGGSNQSSIGVEISETHLRLEVVTGLHPIAGDVGGPHGESPHHGAHTERDENEERGHLHAGDGSVYSCTERRFPVCA
jgi:hypothetical protein